MRLVPSSYDHVLICCVRRAFPLVDLQKRLGADSGTFLYEVVRGLDFSEGASSSDRRSTRLMDF